MFPESPNKAPGKLDEKRTTLTLAEAIARRDVVQKVLPKDDPFLTESPILITQPVATNWMATAASAGASFSDACLKEMKAHGEQEMKLASRLIQPESRIDIDALNTFLEKYAKPSTRSKSGNTNSVPSMHFTSCLVARCLYELRQRNLDFIAPFINILAFGCVSYSATRAYVSKMFDKLQVKFTSFASILSQKETLHAMEALFCIPDLPETDVVRCAQYASRLRRQCMQSRANQTSSPNTKKRPRSELEIDPVLVKAHRVMLRCVTAHVDRVQLVKALNSIPISDVKEFLAYFCEAISQMSTRPFDLRSGNDSSKVENYRGNDNWLDGKYTRSGNSELKGCMKWAEAVIDAHMASILLDFDSHAIVEKLFSCVTEQRANVEAYSLIPGALDHLQFGIPLPDHKELYRGYSLQVKASLWLEE